LQNIVNLVTSFDKNPIFFTNSLYFMSTLKTYGSVLYMMDNSCQKYRMTAWFYLLILHFYSGTQKEEGRGFYICVCNRFNKARKSFNCSLSQVVQFSFI
jgi:hypothetical protein